MGDRGWRWRLLAGLSVVLVVGVSVVVVRRWRSSDGCHTDLGESESVDDLTLDRRSGAALGEPPEAMHDADREAYDGAVQALRQPRGTTLGDLDALYPGTYDPESTTSWDVPRPVGLWDDTLMVATSSAALPGMPWEAMLTGMDLDGAESLRWVRSFEGSGLGGGRVGERFVAMGIPEDRAPEVLSIDPVDGEVVWCRPLGPDGDTPFQPALDGSQTPDGDPVVTRFITDDDETAPGARTVRLDADSGDVQWELTDDQPDPVRKQVAAGSLVIQASRDEGGPEPLVSWGQDGELRQHDEPVMARNVDDGTVAWIHTPASGDDTVVSQFVIGATEERVVVAQGRAEVRDPGGSRSPDDVTRGGRLVALDHEGEVQWELDVPLDTLLDAARTFTVAGDLLVGPTGDGLGAWHLDDGSVAWNVAREGLRLNRAEVAGDHLLVPGSGLTEIDLRNGAAAPVLGDGVDIDRILVGDEDVALRTSIGIALFLRR